MNEIQSIEKSFDYLLIIYMEKFESDSSLIVFILVSRLTGPT